MKFLSTISACLISTALAAPAPPTYQSPKPILRRNNVQDVNNSTDAGSVGAVVNLIGGNNGVPSIPPLWTDITTTFTVPSFSPGSGDGPWTAAIRVGTLIYQEEPPLNSYSVLWTYAWAGVYAQVATDGSVSTQFYWSAEENDEAGGGYVTAIAVSQGDEVRITLKPQSLLLQTSLVTFENLTTGKSTSVTLSTYLYLALKSWSAVYWSLDETWLDISKNMTGIPAFTDFTLKNCSASSPTYNLDLTYAQAYNQEFGYDVPASTQLMNANEVSFSYAG